MYQGYFCLLFQCCLGFTLSLSLTLLNVLGFGNRHDKTAYKTQSHSFSKLLIVTVIVTASS